MQITFSFNCWPDTVDLKGKKEGLEDGSSGVHWVHAHPVSRDLDNIYCSYFGWTFVEWRALGVSNRVSLWERGRFADSLGRRLGSLEHRVGMTIIQDWGFQALGFTLRMQLWCLTLGPHDRPWGDQIKHYFWGHLGGCFWVRWTFESVGCVKHTSLPSMDEPPSIHWGNE